LKAKRLHVTGDFPEFVESGTGYKVRLDPHGSGTCTCPDFQVRIAQESRLGQEPVIGLMADQSADSGRMTGYAEVIPGDLIAPLQLKLTKTAN